MQRRSFLKTLAGGLLATKLAFDLGAKAVETLTTDTSGSLWEAAPFEAVVWNPSDYLGNWEWKIDENPPRFHLVDGKYVQIQ